MGERGEDEGGRGVGRARRHGNKSPGAVLPVEMPYVTMLMERLRRQWTAQGGAGSTAKPSAHVGGDVTVILSRCDAVAPLCCVRRGNASPTCGLHVRMSPFARMPALFILLPTPSLLRRTGDTMAPSMHGAELHVFSNQSSIQCRAYSTLAPLPLCLPYAGTAKRFRIKVLAPVPLMLAQSTSPKLSLFEHERFAPTNCKSSQPAWSHGVVWIGEGGDVPTPSRARKETPTDHSGKLTRVARAHTTGWGVAD